jgi:heptosyltransferase-3
MIADAVDLALARRALVIKLRHHGDVLLTSPVFAVLKAHAPHLELDALVYDDTAEMLSLHPAIAQLHTIGRCWRELSLWQRLAHERKLLRGLRARHYDLVVHLTEHPRGALLTRWLRPRASVAPSRPGNERWWQGSFTHRYPLLRNGRRHAVESNLDALRRIGVQPGFDERRLVLVPGSAAEASADALLHAHGLTARGFVHFHPASRWHFKCWPSDRCAELVDALSAEGHRIVLTAAPTVAERSFVESILKHSGAATRVVNLTGQLSLKQLAALTARARLFVGVDSAPMHIAAAMQTPVVVLFGPSGDLEWGPWQVPHRVVSSAAHPCRPCGQDGCGGGKISECLTTLPTARVREAVHSLLLDAR